MPALLVDEQAGVFFSTREDEGAEGILFAQATACAKFHGDAESERILYVAATRARDMLIFSGNVSQKADGTCGSSGWLKALSGNSSVQALLDRAQGIAPLKGVICQRSRPCHPEAERGR